MKTINIKHLLLTAFTAAVMTACSAPVDVSPDNTKPNTTQSADTQPVDGLFCRGLLAVWTRGLWGYVDRTGEYVIEPQFDCAADFFKSDIAVVEQGEKWGYIDITGAYVILPLFDDAYSFKENGLA